MVIDGYIDGLVVETARMKINGFNIRIKQNKSINTFPKLLTVTPSTYAGITSENIQSPIIEKMNIGVKNLVFDST
mgnify:CR=1 FL=1